MTEPADQISNAERIGWQRQAAALLGKLLDLAQREGLPPVAWTVQSAGASLVGPMLGHPDARRREEFGAWTAAITAASGKAPGHDNEHTSGGSEGETRLTAAWEYLPGGLPRDSKRQPGERRPGARVALVASIWSDGGEG